MEFNLSRPILSFDDTPIRDINADQAKYILTQCSLLVGEIADEATQTEFKEKAPGSILGNTLSYRDVIRRALINYHQEDKPSQKEQLERYDLLLKLVADRVELESEEITKIKAAVAKMYKNPMVVGRVRDLLERKNESSEPSSAEDAKEESNAEPAVEADPGAELCEDEADGAASKKK